MSDMACPGRPLGYNDRMAQLAYRPKPVSDVPPLQAGDRLTREEFERRWEMHPEIKKAELIDGLVFTEMTVSPRHGEPHSALMVWLGSYWATRSELQMLDNTTVRMPGEDDLQPDILLRCREGGTSRLVEDEAIEGPPEFVAEIAASSASYDMHLKKEAYRRGGVQEYLVWQVYEQRIDWWALEDSEYAAIEPDADGIVTSRLFAGLRLNVAALLAGDLSAVLASLTAGSQPESQ
jgi:Uma2 family endonuclease